MEIVKGAVTLRDRLAELFARPALVLPPDHDRRGWFIGDRVADQKW